MRQSSAVSGARAEWRCRWRYRIRRPSLNMSCAIPTRPSSSLTRRCVTWERRSRARFVLAEDALSAEPFEGLPLLRSDHRALIIYTSGTTGRPKGAVTTHQMIGAQISSLISAWRWTPSDHLLLVLPLHHVHGIINGLGCALAIRATCEMLYPFDAPRVWQRLASCLLYTSP